MLNLLVKVPFFKLYRSFEWPKMLPVSLTVSLTYRCNSRCMTCRVYERESNELTLDEYGKIFHSIGHSPHWITFSGGEPFLRQDMEEICIKAYELCRPKIINIPTNGILTERIIEKVRCIQAACPDAAIIINLSIDAIGEKHDDIRGSKGSFERVIETYKGLRSIKKDGNMTLGFHTVISKFNVGEIADIYRELKKYRPDSYITEIAEERTELLTVNEKISPSFSEYSSAVDYITGDMKDWEMKGIARVTRAFRKHYYHMVKKILRENRMQIPCYGGLASCQLTPDGDVWACCVKSEVLGNLRESGYDFKKIWFSQQAVQLRRAIKNRECFCPLANASYTNMLFSLKTLAQVGTEVLLRK